MQIIEPAEVIAAVRRQLDRAGEPLKIESANLDAVTNEAT